MAGQLQILSGWVPYLLPSPSAVPDRRSRVQRAVLPCNRAETAHSVTRAKFRQTARARGAWSDSVACGHQIVLVGQCPPGHRLVSACAQSQVGKACEAHWAGLVGVPLERRPASKIGRADYLQSAVGHALRRMSDRAPAHRAASAAQAAIGWEQGTSNEASTHDAGRNRCGDYVDAER